MCCLQLERVDSGAPAAFGERMQMDPCCLISCHRKFDAIYGGLRPRLVGLFVLLLLPVFICGRRLIVVAAK